MSIILSAIAIISIVAYELVIPPTPDYTPEDHITFNLLEEVEGKYLIVNHPTSYARAYYSLMAMKSNLSTPSGWMDTGTSSTHAKNLYAFDTLLEDTDDCEAIEKLAEEIQVEEVITTIDICTKLEKCNIRLKKEEGGLCLFRFLG